MQRCSQLNTYIKVYICIDDADNNNDSLYDDNDDYNNVNNEKQAYTSTCFINL